MEWRYARFYSEHRLVRFAEPQHRFYDSAVAIFTGNVKHDSDPMAVRFDFKVDVLAIVALLGEHGWELVASDGEFGMWFKRPALEPAPGVPS